MACAWLLGIALLFLRAAFRALRLRAVLRRARPVDAQSLLARCAGQLGLRRLPRLLRSREVRTPFLVALPRPTVVLPERQSAADLRFVLLHELAHLKRRDHWWIAPELFLRTLYFFHPLMHWAWNRLRAERELRCDREVVRATGEQASYAAFLLDEIHRAGRARPAGVAIAVLGRNGATIRRRIRTILETPTSRKESTMSGKLRGTLTLAIALSALAALLALGPAPARAQETPAKKIALDHINATPIEAQSGVYHVSPVFASVAMVKVFPRKGPYSPEHTRTLKTGEFTFESASGTLRLGVPVDDKTKMVTIHGVRSSPWAWNTGGPIEKGSVKLDLGDRKGVEGVDFAVDADQGRIRYLEAELGRREQKYMLTYTLREDPARPGQGLHCAIGNFIPKRARSDSTGPEPVIKPGQIGTNPSPTATEGVYVLTQPMRSDDCWVAFVTKKDGEYSFRWLARGGEFSYDASDGRIVLLGNVRVEGEARLHVRGTPRDKALFLFHEAVEKDKVSVVVDGRSLTEGEDFTVDYEKGIIKVKDPALLNKGAKYRVTAGSRTYGN